MSILNPIIEQEPISKAEWDEARERTRFEAPKKLPPDWLRVEIPRDNPAYGARAYQSKDGLQVVFSCGRHDSKWWLHVSVVREGRCPDYDDLARVKRLFVGDARQALQIFPPRWRHVNLHPTCLHLWCCLDGDGLPDFGKRGSI